MTPIGPVGRRLTETQPYSFPTARRPPLASGQVVGISFAVVLAAGLVLIVILAICVPGIRDMIGRTGVSHQHTMRTRAPQTARENSAAHSAKAPVNYSAGSKNSSVDSEELTAFNKKRKNRIDLSDSDDVESSLSIRNSGEASD